MFITFEGGEAAGKTTLATLLFEKLTSQNYQVILTKEPGGYSFFSCIREILLNPDIPPIADQTEALLYAADRIEHLKHVILPALKKQKIVICDRYLDSSFVYQGYARNLCKNYIAQINNFALKHLPDITFYLDLDPLLGKKRLDTFRADSKNRLDLENLTFHENIRKGYQQLAACNPQRIITINADDQLETIFGVIYQKIINLLCNF